MYFLLQLYFLLRGRRNRPGLALDGWWLEVSKIDQNRNSAIYGNLQCSMNGRIIILTISNAVESQKILYLGENQICQCQVRLSLEHP
jgi:hypothetical protein